MLEPKRYTAIVAHGLCAWMAAFAAAIVLVACGGGGEDSPEKRSTTQAVTREQGNQEQSGGEPKTEGSQGRPGEQGGSHQQGAPGVGTDSQNQGDAPQESTPDQRRLGRAELIQRADAICDRSQIVVGRKLRDVISSGEPIEKTAPLFVERVLLPELKGQVMAINGLSVDGSAREPQQVAVGALKVIIVQAHDDPEGFISQGQPETREAKAISRSVGFKRCGAAI